MTTESSRQVPSPVCVCVCVCVPKRGDRSATTRESGAATGAQFNAGETAFSSSLLAAFRAVFNRHSVPYVETISVP